MKQMSSPLASSSEYRVACRASVGNSLQALKPTMPGAETSLKSVSARALIWEFRELPGSSPPSVW
jgi:hypothetical protein